MALTKDDLQAIGALMDGKLEPIKTDIKELKQGLTATNARLDDMEEKLEVVRASQLNIENKYLPKIQVSLDAYVQSQDQYRRIEGYMEITDDKLDDHEVRLTLLEMPAQLKK